MRYGKSQPSRKNDPERFSQPERHIWFLIQQQFDLDVTKSEFNEFFSSNTLCKLLDLNNVKELFAEDLKGVKHKSKGRIRKKFNNKLQRWVYKDVLNKLTMLCEETGILFRKIPPQYTSQRCSSCGVICKSNRNGEVYKCACGMLMDADLNASINILHIGKYGFDALQPIP